MGIIIPGFLSAGVRPQYEATLCPSPAVGPLRTDHFPSRSLGLAIGLATVSVQRVAGKHRTHTRLRALRSPAKSF